MIMMIHTMIDKNREKEIKKKNELKYYILILKLKYKLTCKSLSYLCGKCMFW